MTSIVRAQWVLEYNANAFNSTACTHLSAGLFTNYLPISYETWQRRGNKSVCLFIVPQWFPRDVHEFILKLRSCINVATENVQTITGRYGHQTEILDLTLGISIKDESWYLPLALALPPAMMLFHCTVPARPVSARFGSGSGSGKTAPVSKAALRTALCL